MMRWRPATPEAPTTPSLSLLCRGSNLDIGMAGKVVGTRLAAASAQPILTTVNSMLNPVIPCLTCVGRYPAKAVCGAGTERLEIVFDERPRGSEDSLWEGLLGYFHPGTCFEMACLLNLMEEGKVVGRYS